MDAREELLAAERAVMAAIRSKDRAALAPLLSEEFVLRTPDSDEVGKAAFLEQVAAIAGTIQAVEGEGVKASVFGDLAVVTGTQVARVLLPDRTEPVTGRGVFTDVFRREDGRWRLVLAHTAEMR